MSVDASGEITLEDASDFAVCLAFRASAFDVSTSLLIVDHTDHRDDIQRAVELPVSAAVESMPCGVPRRCRDRVPPAIAANAASLVTRPG